MPATGAINTFTSSANDYVNIVGSDPLTDSTISLSITLERAEDFARELLAVVDAKRRAGAAR